MSATFSIGISVLHHLVVLHLRSLPLNKGCGLGMLSRNYLHSVKPLPPRCLLEVSHLRRHIICGVVLLHRLVGGRYRILLVLPRWAHKVEPVIHNTPETGAPLEFRVRHHPLIGIIIKLV